MLKLCAAEMRLLREKEPNRKLVWVDIGGGTGWNIEQMNKFFPIAEFDQIYLIDLCEPLLKVARERFERLGYKNVQALCQNAKDFTLPGLADERKVDLFTCSYSISMTYWTVSTNSLTRALVCLVSPTFMCRAASRRRTR